MQRMHVLECLQQRQSDLGDPLLAEGPILRQQELQQIPPRTVFHDNADAFLILECSIELGDRRHAFLQHILHQLGLPFDCSQLGGGGAVLEVHLDCHCSSTQLGTLRRVDGRLFANSYRFEILEAGSAELHGARPIHHCHVGRAEQSREDRLLGPHEATGAPHIDSSVLHINAVPRAKCPASEKRSQTSRIQYDESNRQSPR
mmetsp:Transcript_20464/g.61608  ORF Transcript_20464/g.61608 Transcript_20464/m.61608 type:complete len:202 (+) Transcript_20464:1377-1982(+)